MTGIGQRIREARGEETQTAFARALGYTLRQISAWEREEAGPPPEFFQRLYQRSQVDLQWLLTGVRAVVHESQAAYGTSIARQIAADLDRHPELLPLIRQMFKLDGRFLTQAQALAEALDIPLAGAALILLLRHNKTPTQLGGA